MGKVYDGEITLHFSFHDLLAEDSETLIDVLFPVDLKGN